MDLSTISIEELKKDLADTELDIVICQRALELGVITYFDGKSVQARLDTNLEIKGKIEAELARRQDCP